ncbi:hypothetical protein BDV93DRAFT_513675 [Ceratobasidium sp. AG-I]|nr:hypothetical protein BDV93DRAFT_513675 [Ceratobasidium sp. AG-I]
MYFTYFRQQNFSLELAAVYTSRGCNITRLTNVVYHVPVLLSSAFSAQALARQAIGMLSDGDKGLAHGRDLSDRLMELEVKIARRAVDGPLTEVRRGAETAAYVDEGECMRDCIAVDAPEALVLYLSSQNELVLPLVIWRRKSSTFAQGARSWRHALTYHELWPTRSSSPETTRLMRIASRTDESATMTFGRGRENGEGEHGTVDEPVGREVSSSLRDYQQAGLVKSLFGTGATLRRRLWIVNRRGDGRV